MKTPIATSSTRSKKTWLLWLAPLLVPAIWFVRDYYDKRKEVVEISLPPENVEALPAASAAATTAKSPSPYEQLALLLKQQPNTSKLVVNWSEQPLDSVYVYGSLEYNRRDGTLKDRYSATFGTGRSYLWNKVTDKALHAVARSLSNRRQNRAETLERKTLLPPVSVEDILNRTYAKTIFTFGFLSC